MTRLILHTPGGRTVTMHPRTKSNDGLHVFLHRATRRVSRDAEFTQGTAVTYQKNKQERGNATVSRVSTAKKDHVYVQTETEGVLLVPVSELRKRGSGDSAGAGLIGGGNRPEGRHARRTPIDATRDALGEGQSVVVNKPSSSFHGKTGKVISVDSFGTVYVDFPGGGSGTFKASELRGSTRDATYSGEEWIDVSKKDYDRLNVGDTYRSPRNGKTGKVLEKEWMSVTGYLKVKWD